MALVKLGIGHSVELSTTHFLSPNMAFFQTSFVIPDIEGTNDSVISSKN